MSKACPKCGSTKGFTILEHHITMEYSGSWGDPGSVEHVDTHHHGGAAQFVRCWNCAKLTPKSVAFAQEGAQEPKEGGAACK